MFGKVHVSAVESHKPNSKPDVVDVTPELSSVHAESFIRITPQPVVNGKILDIPCVSVAFPVPLTAPDESSSPPLAVTLWSCPSTSSLKDRLKSAAV